MLLLKVLLPLSFESFPPDLDVEEAVETAEEERFFVVGDLSTGTLPEHVTGCTDDPVSEAAFGGLPFFGREEVDVAVLTSATSPAVTDGLDVSVVGGASVVLGCSTN